MQTKGSGLSVPVLRVLVAWQAVNGKTSARCSSNAGFVMSHILFALKGGVFAPVFTGNHLRATGRGEQPHFLIPLEFAAIGAIFVLAAADLGVGEAHDLGDLPAQMMRPLRVRPDDKLALLVLGERTGRAAGRA